MRWDWTALHAALWALGPLASSLLLGTPFWVGLVLPVLGSAALAAWQLRAPLVLPASLVGPVVGALLFAGAWQLTVTHLPDSGWVQPDASQVGVAVDAAAVGLLVAGFVAPGLEALSLRAALDPTPERAFVGRYTLRCYLALGLGALVWVGLLSVPASLWPQDAVALSADNLAVVGVAALVGGLRQGALGAALDEAGGSGPQHAAVASDAPGAR